MTYSNISICYKFLNNQALCYGYLMRSLDSALLQVDIEKKYHKLLMGDETFLLENRTMTYD
jgi:hypothetical protein